MRGYYDWRRWVRRRDLTIGEFEDVWNGNNRYEVAKGLLLALPEMEGISTEDKVEFLVDLVVETRDIDTGCEKERLTRLGVNPDKLSKNILKPALQTFFEIVPVWDEGLEKPCRVMLVNLSYLSRDSLKGLEGKIKNFVHSYLNTHKKEEMDEDIVARVLVNNRMFEELVNYDFTSNTAIAELINQYVLPFQSCGPGSLPSMSYLWCYIKLALEQNREPHAVSTFLRLLAKRGDLEKIF